MSESKKEIAVNTHLLLPVILFIVFLIFSITSAADNMIGLAIGFALVCLLAVLIFATSPLYFVFSCDNVEIVYNFGLREQIRWDSIRRISVEGSWILRGQPPNYHLAYPKSKKTCFLMTGDISKTVRTKRLMKKYYKKEIF